MAQTDSDFDAIRDDPRFRALLPLPGEIKSRNEDAEHIMAKKRKLLEKILAGSKNIQFSEMVSLVEAFGFRLARITGSHHIFEHPDIPDLINLQNQKGNAKPYQIRQFLAIVEQHNLTLEDGASEQES